MRVSDPLRTDHPVEPLRRASCDGVQELESGRGLGVNEVIAPGLEVRGDLQAIWAAYFSPDIQMDGFRVGLQANPDNGKRRAFRLIDTSRVTFTWRFRIDPCPIRAPMGPVMSELACAPEQN